MTYTFETRQERITVSYRPTRIHGHTNSWCLLEIAYSNYLECSYTIWYVYNNKLDMPTRTKIVSKKHIQPTGFGAYSSTWF